MSDERPRRHHAHLRLSGMAHLVPRSNLDLGTRLDHRVVRVAGDCQAVTEGAGSKRSETALIRLATLTLVLAFMVSGATGVPAPSADSRAQVVNGSRVAPDTPLGAKRRASPQACPTARKAVRFYAGRVAYWRSKMRTSLGTPWRPRETTALGCPRYLAHVLQRKAYGLRRAYERWHAYHYDWASWLPDKWQRIGACETGYGRRPGNWRHANSSYEGAFGFAKSSWDAFKRQADPKAGPYPEDAWQATPRQQWEVALAIWRVYGFSGWGCRGA